MITVDIKATQQAQASKERIQGGGSKAAIPGNGWNIRTWERHGEAGRPHGKLTQRARERLNTEGRVQAQRRQKLTPMRSVEAEEHVSSHGRTDTPPRGYPPRKGKVGV